MYWDAADCTVIRGWRWNPRDTASTTRCPACDFRVYVLRTRESVVGGQQVQEVVPLKLRTIYGQWLIWASPNQPLAINGPEFEGYNFLNLLTAYNGLSCP